MDLRNNTDYSTHTLKIIAKIKNACKNTQNMTFKEVQDLIQQLIQKSQGDEGFYSESEQEDSKKTQIIRNGSMFSSNVFNKMTEEQNIEIT